jgi:hypothetical protein
MEEDKDADVVGGVEGLLTCWNPPSYALCLKGQLMVML